MRWVSLSPWFVVRYGTSDVKLKSDCPRRVFAAAVAGSGLIGSRTHVSSGSDGTFPPREYPSLEPVREALVDHNHGQRARKWKFFESGGVFLDVGSSGDVGKPREST